MRTGNGQGQETTRRLLSRAQQIAGGRAQLAERLGVSPQELDGWLAGTSKAPWPVVEKAIDLILDAYSNKD